ncbi:MAG: malonyl-ACP O-methyltransferase BioC [Lysobacterales bacterium]
MNLDSRRVRAAFGRAAPGYAALARLQAQIEDQLLERVGELPLQPARILDVGAGTGRAAAALRRRFTRAETIALDLALPMLKVAARRVGWWRPFRRVCADANALPIADGSIDLLFSNLCLQWCEDLPRVFAEFRRVLRPGGWLLMSSFGPDTLIELRHSFAAVDGDPHINRFLDLHELGDALLAAGFKDPMLDVERLRIGYPDVPALMRELKGIGAGNADRERRRGLTGRRRMQRVFGHYETLRGEDGQLPASYEINFAQAIAPDSHVPRREHGMEIASVSLDALRATLPKTKDRGGSPSDR